MKWNLFRHIIAGVIGLFIFTFNTNGILFAVAITAVGQGIDMFRLQFYLKGFKGYPSGHQGSIYYFKLFQFYLLKVIFYALVTLVVAFLARKLFVKLFV